MKLTDTAIAIAKKVKLLILDVDGVLTDGGIYFDDSGNEFKRFNSLDGHGIKMLLESGIEVGVISARSASAVAHRMKTLGVRHLYQNQANKNEALQQLLEKLSLGVNQVAFVGDDVEIGAGTTIDRGAIDDTIIEQGVKIDNQVQIGHNCHIGEHSVICGCTAIAGSVKLGKYCVMGGASGAVGHITIADKVQVSAMSLVSQSIKEAGTYSSGTGHMKTKDWKRNIVRFAQLDSIAKRLKELEKTSDKN